MRGDSEQAALEAEYFYFFGRQVSFLSVPDTLGRGVRRK